jgi:hypothetical protein
MRVLIIVIQLVLSLVVTASVMPVIFVTMPAAADQKVGLAMMTGVLVVTFVVIAMVWPGRKRQF